jgi:hypothetical protein
MYAIVKKVVKPAWISVKNFDPGRSFGYRTSVPAIRAHVVIAGAYMAGSIQTKDPPKGRSCDLLVENLDGIFDGRHWEGR